MSKHVLSRLSAEFSTRILESTSFRGDDQAIVDRADYKAVAKFLKSDPECAMDMLIDLTAIDWPEREPDLPRFDVVLMLRSTTKNHRVRIKARLGDGESIPTVNDLWPAADWAEREVFDMFGIRFDGHGDMRRILMYDEFVGHPLRKDYPIDKTQPLIPYREVRDIDKLPPFGADEGQPWGRVDWQERLAGRDQQVSPAIGEQVGQRPALSKGPEYQERPETAED